MSKKDDLQKCIEEVRPKYPDRYDFWFQADVKECMKGKGYVYVGTGERNDDADDENAWKRS